MDSLTGRESGQAAQMFTRSPERKSSDISSDIESVRPGRLLLRGRKSARLFCKIRVINQALAESMVLC